MSGVYDDHDRLVAACLEAPSAFGPRPRWGRGHEFARRNMLYTRLDQCLYVTTRFFAAAALVNEVFAQLFRRVPIGVSQQSFAFLSELASSLEPVNLHYARRIRDGDLCGPRLDRALVCLEQQHVQRWGQRWAARSPLGWRAVRHELNALLNAYHPMTLLAPCLPCGRQLLSVLTAARQDLGVDVDFANDSHRIRIGYALVQYLHKD